MGSVIIDSTDLSFRIKKVEKNIEISRNTLNSKSRIGRFQFTMFMIKAFDVDAFSIKKLDTYKEISLMVTIYPSFSNRNIHDDF